LQTHLSRRTCRLTPLTKCKRGRPTKAPQGCRKPRACVENPWAIGIVPILQDASGTLQRDPSWDSRAFWMNSVQKYMWAETSRKRQMIQRNNFSKFLAKKIQETFRPLYSSRYFSKLRVDIDVLWGSTPKTRKKRRMICGTKLVRSVSLPKPLSNSQLTTMS